VRTRLFVMKLMSDVDSGIQSSAAADENDGTPNASPRQEESPSGGECVLMWRRTGFISTGDAQSTQFDHYSEQENRVLALSSVVGERPTPCTMPFPEWRIHVQYACIGSNRARTRLSVHSRVPCMLETNESNNTIRTRDANTRRALHGGE